MNRFIYKLLIPIVTLLVVTTTMQTVFASGDHYLRISDSKGNVVATVRCSEGTASAGDLKAGTYRVTVVDIEGKLIAVDAMLTYEITMPGITIKAEGSCKRTEKPNTLEVDQVKKTRTAQNEFTIVEDGSSVSFRFTQPQQVGPLQAMQTLQNTK